MNIQLDDGVSFGLGLFETICLLNKKPLFLGWHLERINASLKCFGIENQVAKEEVDAWLSDKAVEPLSALKIMVSEKNKLFLLRENHYTDEVINKGFDLDYSNVLRNETSALTFHKTMNYGDNILEKRKTKCTGIDEYIFLNSKGEITEGSTTNIFFVKNGKILTPKKECGLLPGVVRRFVLETFDCDEVCIFPSDVKDMDECFVTNSLMGVMHVNRLFDKEFHKGPVCDMIQKKYKEII